MKNGSAPRLSPRKKAAVAELKGRILEKFPSATFRLSRDPDEDSTIVMWTTVDTDDLDEVSDTVVGREMDMLIGEGISILTVPIWTPERNAREIEEQRREREAANLPIIS